MKLQFNELMLVEDKLEHILSSSDGLTKNLCIKLLEAGGKRLRPFLTLQSGMCFAPLNNAMIDAAVASELIHMASLVHDDIIDQSKVRRGQRTVNDEYGNHCAVLTGDFIFAQAFSLLSRQNLLEPLQFMCQAIQSMCRGEINQAKEQFDPGVSFQQYFKRIELKTASLLVASCKSGAVCGGANEYELGLMEEYATQLGYAYQILDDVNDYIGKQNQMGKPFGSDLCQGHITLPLIFLLHDPTYHRWVKDLLRKKEITNEEVAKTLSMLITSGSLDRSIKVAHKALQKAKLALKPLPDTPAKKALYALADQVVEELTEKVV